eukprot:scaffold86825_cov19-Tisochrysis_lutea.AAC.1
MEQVALLMQGMRLQYFLGQGGAQMRPWFVWVMKYWRALCERCVLSMPGACWCGQYPKHSTRDVYMTTAAQDGVDLEL